MAVEDRLTVGGLTVPYMVDETRSPIDFKVVSKPNVEDCARNGKCGVCGGKIRRGPIAFIGPDDGRRCFGDPWMHPDCARLAMQQCPFLSRRKGWSDAADAQNPLLTKFEQGMVIVLAQNWRAHYEDGGWHFMAFGPLTRLEPD